MRGKAPTARLHGMYRERTGPGGSRTEAVKAPAHLDVAAAAAAPGGGAYVHDLAVLRGRPPDCNERWCWRSGKDVSELEEDHSQVGQADPPGRVIFEHFMFELLNAMEDDIAVCQNYH